MIDPAGTEAAGVMDLFWICVAGAAALYAAGIGLLLYAMRRPPPPGAVNLGRRLILYGGVVLPTVVLAGLAVAGLRLMVDLRDMEGEMTVRVTGEQFWWRIEYLDDGGHVLAETANEIHVPVGVPVTFELDTADVIHSFWVPTLAGKMDMVPGRRNQLVIEATRTGTFRDQCAEFCGSSHALMALYVVVTDGERYEDWLRAQQQPATAPGSPQARRGSDAFHSYGCGACHRVRGTPASGRLGPDLTHLAARRTIAAGTLPTSDAGLGSWLRHTQRAKPGAAMPAFHMVPAEELDDLAGYLLSLE